MTPAAPSPQESDAPPGETPSLRLVARGERGPTLQYILENRASLLADLRSRQTILRDHVVGVAQQRSTGLYLFGRPGTAKTHTVRRVMEQEVRDVYAYQRGHLTPIGLFELLKDHPSETIVLDDVGAVLTSDVALQILLAALESPTGADRVREVRYRRQGRDDRVRFSGGLVVISNKELPDASLLAAFKSRVHVLDFDPSDAHLGALMLDLADRGWPSADAPEIPPAEAGEVARYVIGELSRLGRPFDLRLLFDKALPDYQQWKDGDAESHWQDLVTASIEEHLVAVRHPAESPAPGVRARQQAEGREIAREIVATYSTRDERRRAWTERTGTSERMFYRRLAELSDK